MEKIKVGVVGMGTIGKRVADAIILQEDMELVGVTAKSVNWRIQRAFEKGYSIYYTDGPEELKTARIEVSGSMEELIDKVDIIIDCSPSKQGAKNKEKYYLPKKKKAIFQGGEKVTVAQASFVAQCNYDECKGLDYIRVVSCNTTGLARTIHEVDKLFGVNDVYATLIRRAADPWDIKSGPINGIKPVLELPSHHGPDVKTVLHNIETFTNALSVSTTLMHVHTVTIDCEKIPDKDTIIQAWDKSTRIRIVDGSMGVQSTPQVMEYARDLGRDRGDMPEICIWREAVGTQDHKLLYIQAIHQESDVICENIDAIRSMMNSADANTSIKMTNKSLKIK